MTLSPTQPETAYMNAREVGFTKKLQETACENPAYAYHFARDIKGADIIYCQEAACKIPAWAYSFAHSVRGANIKYCQEHACKDPAYAFHFARNISTADIEYCKQHMTKDLYSVYMRIVMNQILK